VRYAQPTPPGDRFVYVTGSPDTYGTGSRLDAIAKVRRIVEGEGRQLVLPEKRWTDNEAWALGWPLLCPELFHLTFIPAEDGSIGATAMREVFDALTCYVPVTLWVHDTFVPWPGVEVHGVALPSPQIVATVTCRRSVTFVSKPQSESEA
jgi:hypothetical protein